MINWDFPYNSKEWAKLRDRHLSTEPFCVKCSTTLRLQVDHIINHYNRREFFMDSGNLQTLCISCHAVKSNKVKVIKRLKENKQDKIVIKLNQPRGADLDAENFLKQQALSFVRSSNRWEFKIKQKVLNFRQTYNLFELLIHFFIHQGFYCLNFVVLNNATIQAEVYKFFYNSLLEVEN